MQKQVRLYILLVIFFSFDFCYSQGPLVKQWDARFGGIDMDWLTFFQQTKDGGYIIGGTSDSQISGDKTQASQGDFDYWIVKIDSLGNKQWDKTFGGAGYDYMSSLQQTSDGGYILGGFSRSGVGGDKTQALKDTSLNPMYQGDYWIVKVDSLGTKQWDKDFGGVNSDFLYSLSQTTDGGYVLGGYSLSGIGGDKTQILKGGDDYWIIKLDSMGNKQWDRDFGGLSYDELISFQQTKDGGYILGGLSYSGIGGDKTDSNKGGEGYWIIKIDFLGNKMWDKDFGGNDEDYLYSLQQTSDGGYILEGYTYSDISGDKTQSSKDLILGVGNGGDYWIVKTDSLGNKQWDKDFGAKGMEEAFGNIIQTNDGGYLFSGASYSNIGGDKTENNLGAEQTWIVKTDALGIKQWDKTILSPSHDELGFVVQTKEGCYVIAVYTIDAGGGIGGYKTQSSRGGADYWIIKFYDTTQVQQCNIKASFSSSDTAFCDEGGKCIDFTDLSTCNPISWKWFFPGAQPDTSTLRNPKNICYYSPGSYAVTLIVTDSVTSDTLTIYPMIRFETGAAQPVITLFGGDTVCCNPKQTSYQWYYNGAPVPGATDQCYVITFDGFYHVYITDSNGCNRLIPLGCLGCGVNELSNESLVVYPNPAGNELWVVGKGSWGNSLTTVEIFNVLGESVYRIQPETVNGKPETVIDVSFLHSGIYLVVLASGEKISRAKFLKE